MLYIYVLCPHSEHKKIHSNLNSLNTFTKENGSPNVKLVLVRYNFQKLDPMWWSLSLWGQGPTIVTFKHVPNILWWWGWCLSLFADSLKGHEFQLASAEHSVIGTIDYVPTIHAPSISLGQKMVANMIKNRHPIQPMRWGKMHWRGQIFFLRVAVGAWGNLMFPVCFIRFYLVPTKFPKFSMCSQHVPNSTTCNPISFVQTSPLVTYKEKPTIYILGMPKIWSQFYLMGKSRRPIIKKWK
jgi:hypothetical protein